MKTILRRLLRGMLPVGLTPLTGLGVLLMLTLAGPAGAQTVWTKWNNTNAANSNISGTEGRIPLGTSGGDTGGAQKPMVIRDGSIYRMWYAGLSSPSYRIYCATSSDGLTWTKMTNAVPANSDTNSTLGRVPLGIANTGDDYHTVHPFVIKDGAVYRMWYSGYDGATYRIYSATSTDAVVWNKVTNAIPPNSDTISTNRIPLGTSGKGDATHVGMPVVIKDGSVYRMWYAGNDGSWRIYCATSTDAAVWTKISNTAPAASDTTSTLGRVPLGSSGKGDANHVYTACVIKDDAVYRMWYTGGDASANRIFYATSPDGLTWTKFTNAVPANSDTSSTGGRIPRGLTGNGDTNGAFGCSVLREGAVFKMWYSGYDAGSVWRIFYATAPADGPTVSNVAVSATNAVAADLVGSVIATGAAPAQVQVYWGTNDGGFVKSQWQSSSPLAAASVGWVTNTAHYLAPATLYYYRYYATNALGEDWSDSAGTFTTLAAPGLLVAAEPASSVGVTNATLNGRLWSTGGAENPDIYFCWDYQDQGTGSTGAWANVTPMGAAWGAGATFSTTVAVLSGSTYVYRCYATNSTGTNWSEGVPSFSTIYLPAVTNLGSIDTATDNMLQGQVTDTGRETPTVWFYYWPASGGATSTVAMGTQAGAFSTVLYQLAPQSYQYRILASNSAGATWSTISNFACASKAWYVATNGNDSAGTNWFTAYTNIQTALNAARTNDTIYIAGHTFSRTNQVNWTNLLATYLTVRGGYKADAGDPALPGSNNPVLWPTVIKASGNVRALNISNVTNGTLEKVTLTGGAITNGYGGGLNIANCTNLTINACVITNNQTGQSSGTTAAHGYGGGIYSSASLVTLSNCVIRGNRAYGAQVTGTAGYGGGIFNNSGEMRCYDSDISLNDVTAYAAGNAGCGGINNSGTMLLRNCLVQGNLTRNASAGGYNIRHSAAGGSLTLLNCTVANNLGGGIANLAGAVTATNSILWQNGDDVTGSVALAYCDVKDGDSNGVNGCISAEPQFDFGCYLNPGSPCVNQGVGNATDWGLSGSYTTSTNGVGDSGTVDMGYHYTAGKDASFPDLFVKTDGDDAAAGTSWANALKTITRALAVAGDSRRIYIAAGVYTNGTGLETFPLAVSRQSWIELIGAGPTSTVIAAINPSARVLSLSGPNGCVRVSNLTLTGGSLTNGYGSGIYAANCGNVDISSCIITNNQSGQSSGTTAAYGYGGGIYSANNGLVTVSNCVIRRNRAYGAQTTGVQGYGGGIFNSSGEMRCFDSDISLNTVTAYTAGNAGGGGIYNGGTMLLRNCLMQGNQTLNAAAGAYSLCTAANQLTLVNCTVVGNLGGGIGRIGGTASLTNCIVWRNLQDDIIGGTALAYCNISDGDSNGVNGCISADPMFEYGAYLGAGSPCVNQGTGSAVDWGLGSPYTTRTDGNPDSGTVDMGYHYPAGLDAVAYADLYVKTNGDDSAVGTSWGTALKTVTKALSMAGDVRRIYIAAGSYSNNTETFPLSIANRSWIELLGAGSTSTVINAKSAGRVLSLSSVAKARIADLTITGGNTNAGGGVLVANCAEVLISGCNVTNNAGGLYGGGIYASYSDITVNDSLVAQNTANGGVNASGSGAGLYLTASRTVISNCIIRGNSVSGQNNGGLGAFGGGVWNNGTLTMLQSVLAANTVTSTDPPTRQGGGLYNTGVANLRNCLICTNRTTAALTKGDGIYSTGTSTLQNCTVAYNWGEGIRVAGGSAAASNSIFWGNGVDVVGAATLAYCDTQQGLSNGVNGCISADPQFADTSFFHEKSRAGFYTNGYFSGGGWSTNSTTTNNPTIDAGDGGDYANEPQPNGRHLNMGAYGNTPVASMTFLEEPAVFTTLTVHSYPASDVGPNYGTLSGEVLNDGGQGNPDAYICWGTTDGGTSSTGNWQHVIAMGARPMWQLFSTNLIGLSGTTAYRCFVTNAAGWDWSDLQSFGTASPPGVTNNGAFPVFRRTATLSGTITDIGGDTPYVWFYYWVPGGPTNTLVPAPPQQSGAFSATASGLLAGSNYQFQILASNSAGTTWSTVSNFTTVASPATWYAATNGTGLLGTNWSGAFPTVQAALDISENNDTIYLAGHSFQIGTALTWSARANMTICGGFAATNDTVLPGAQDAALWPSALKWVAGVPYHRILLVSGVTNSILRDVTIRDGTVDNSGSAGMGMYANNCQGLTLDSCVITNNTVSGVGVQYGGGLYINNSGLVVTNCLITRNQAAGSGNGTGYGGGIYLNSGGLTMVLSRVTGNTASGAGMGASSSDGGGLHVASGSAVIRQSVIAGNSTTRNGGGTYNVGTLRLENSIVNTNSAVNGDGILANGAVTLMNCTVANNRGEGLRWASGTATVTNSILWGNGDDLTGTVSVAYCAIGTADSFWTHGVNGCITNNPLFVDTTYYHLQSKNGHYIGGYFSGGTWDNSASNSPCIDTGYPDPADPWRGVEPEPNGKRSNMGAYGNTTVASKGAAPSGTIFMVR